MPWNFMQLEIVPEQDQIRPIIGDQELTREQARAQVGQLLIKAGATAAAVIWARGVTGDEVFHGRRLWTIYQHEPGQGLTGAHAWLLDFADQMRRAGKADVRIAKLSQ